MKYSAVNECLVEFKIFNFLGNLLFLVLLLHFPLLFLDVCSLKDMGTEYLVRPLGRAEDEEDATDFEPGKENGEDDELEEEDDDEAGEAAGASGKDGAAAAKRKRPSEDDDDDDDDDSGDDDERPSKR